MSTPYGAASAVTVERSREELTTSGALQPLQSLGDRVEVTIVDGPGAWGLEVHARWRGADRPDQAQTMLEQAVREVRQLAETGEVLHNRPRPAGHRPSTPAGAIVDWAVRHAPRFARLRRLWR